MPALPVRASAYPTCRCRMDCCCTDRRGVQRGVEPLWLWVSNRGEQHPCWHTTFLGKSSVLYLCGADGSRNCSTPWKVRLQLRRSGGKGCPLRGSISDRKKAGRRCGYALSASLVICGTKVYQSPPSASAYHRIRTTTAAFHADCPSPRPLPSLSGSRSDGNGVPRRSAGARCHR